MAHFLNHLTCCTSVLGYRTGMQAQNRKKSLTSGEAHIYSAAYNQVRTSIPQLSVKTYGRTNFHELHTVPYGSTDPNIDFQAQILLLVGP